MNIFQQIQEGFQRIWEAVIRVFQPSDDDYPNSGVQPYEGDEYKEQ